MGHERFKHFERPTAATPRQPYARAMVLVGISMLLLIGFVLVVRYPSIMEFLIDSGFISDDAINNDATVITRRAPYELYAVYENSVAFLTPTEPFEPILDQHAFTYGTAVTSNGWFLFPVALDGAVAKTYSIQFQEKTYAISELRTDTLEGISAIKVSLSNARPVEFLRSIRSYQSAMFSIGRPPESLFRATSFNQLKESGMLFTEDGRLVSIIALATSTSDALREVSALDVYSVTRRLITGDG